VKRIVVLALAILMVFVFTACEDTTEVVFSSDEVTPGAMQTKIILHADKATIQQYFPDETKGDLYIGEIAEIKIIGVKVSKLYLRYADGIVVSPGYLPRGKFVKLGCRVLLFNKANRVKLDRMKPCPSEVL